MFSSVITLFACLTVAACAKAEPYRGYPVPFFPETVTIGTEAPKDTAPWHVSLQYGFTTPRHFCSGAIINTNWVITSGHCVINIPNYYGNLIVVAGLSDLTSPDSTTQTKTVVNTVVHPKYEGDAGPDDIAMLKVSSAFSTTSAVKPIALPPASSIPSGSVLLTSWASTWRTYFPHVSNKLQVLTLTVTSLSECREKLGPYTSQTSITSSNVCTRALPGGFTACNSDPGSPLVGKRGTSFTLEGIVSWGIVPCGTKDVPLIYTQVSSYVTWIRQVIDKN